MPCESCADKSGVVRTQQTWEEGFLITEPMHDNDTMLLFEVLNYIEERSSAGDPEGHLAHCVGLAWAYLNVDRALEVGRHRYGLQRPEPQRLRLQLHRYKRTSQGGDLDDSTLRSGYEQGAPDVAGRPAVYKELRGLVNP